MKSSGLFFSFERAVYGMVAGSAAGLTKTPFDIADQYRQDYWGNSAKTSRGFVIDSADTVCTAAGNVVKGAAIGAVCANPGTWPICYAAAYAVKTAHEYTNEDTKKNKYKR